MRALLSIKPEHVKNIFNGSKTFEYRRKVFSRGAVRSVVVYSTRPVGMIVGEFDILEVIAGYPPALWELTEEGAGIDRTYFDSYFNGRSEGFALRIGSVRQYTQPVMPKSINPAFVPPQSFMYIEDRDGFGWLNGPQEEMFS